MCTCKPSQGCKAQEQALATYTPAHSSLGCSQCHPTLQQAQLLLPPRQANILPCPGIHLTQWQSTLSALQHTDLRSAPTRAAPGAAAGGVGAAAGLGEEVQQLGRQGAQGAGGAGSGRSCAGLHQGQGHLRQLALTGVGHQVGAAAQQPAQLLQRLCGAAACKRDGVS